MWRVLLVCAVGVADAQPAKPPHGATKITIDYERSGWTRQQESYTIEWKNGAYVASNKAAFDPKLVEDLYGSLSNMRDSTESLRCRSHTDDYPRFKVVVDGAEPLVITTDSNCEQYRPWNITMYGKLYVQFTGKVWTGVGGMMAALNKDWEKRRVRMSMGGIEMVPLGTYPRTTTGEPAACAKSFETNPQLRQLFGDPLKVDELGLTCELDSSPSECSTPNGRATFKWQGLSATVRVQCTKGQVTLAAKFVAVQRSLATFVASKPVRALVKIAPTAPRMWEVAGWNVQAVEPGLPWLALDGTTINVRVIDTPDPKFWKELGLDVAKLPRKNGNVEVTLDFAGKLVK